MRNVDRDNLRALPDEIIFHFLRSPAQLALWRMGLETFQITWLNETEALVIVVGRLKDLLNLLRRVDSPGLSIPCDFGWGLDPRTESQACIEGLSRVSACAAGNGW